MHDPIFKKGVDQSLQAAGLRRFYGFTKSIAMETNSSYGFLPAQAGTTIMRNEIPSRQRGPSRLKRFLPPINTPRYHMLLAAVAIFILGPLGGISAAYMNFSLGF